MEAMDGRVGVIAVVALALAGRPIVATGSGDSTGALLGVGIALILLDVATVGVALLLANRYGKPSGADSGCVARRSDARSGCCSPSGSGYLWRACCGSQRSDSTARTARH